MLEGVGIAVDDPGIAGVVVRSVDTDQGPGLGVTVSYRVEDVHENSVDDTDARERRS